MQFDQRPAETHPSAAQSLLPKRAVSLRTPPNIGKGLCDGFHELRRGKKFRVFAGTLRHRRTRADLWTSDRLHERKFFIFQLTCSVQIWYAVGVIGGTQLSFLTRSTFAFSGAVI